MIIMRSCSAFHFKEEVMHDGVLLMDRTMASKNAPAVNMLPLTAAACLLISARQGTPSPQVFITTCPVSCQPSDQMSGAHVPANCMGNKLANFSSF